MGIRYQERITSADRVAKSSCYLCTENSGGFVDLDIIIEGEGRLFLCKKHVARIARVFKFIKPEEAEELEKQNAELQAVVKLLRTELQDLNELNESLREYWSKQVDKRA